MINSKKQNGITLIALVITIIILLILAGVTISIVIDENGILGKSEKAKEETNEKTATEIINLKITNAQLQSYKDEQKIPDLQYLADRLCEDGEIAYVKVKDKEIASLADNFLLPRVKIESKEDTILTKLNEYPYEFEIDGNLRLASVNGVKVADNSTEELKKEMVELRQQNDDLLKRIEKLESQSRNIERVNLTNQSLKIPLTTSYVEKDLGEIKLLESIEKYKYLEIQVDIIAKGEIAHGEKTVFLAVNQIKYNNSNDINWTNETIIPLNVDYKTSNTWAGVGGWFKDNKTMHFGTAKAGNDITSFRIKKIYGVN